MAASDRPLVPLNEGDNMKWILLILMLAGTGWLILEEQYWWAGGAAVITILVGWRLIRHSLSRAIRPN